MEFPPAAYLHEKEEGQRPPKVKKDWEVHGKAVFTGKHPVKSLHSTPEKLPDSVVVLTEECRVLSPSSTRIVGFTDGSMVDFKGGVGVVLRAVASTVPRESQ